MSEINVGDFVEYRDYRWIVINTDTEFCDLMNGFQEERWNVEIKAIKLIAKFK
jgi:hypothetical protein